MYIVYLFLIDKKEMWCLPLMSKLVWTMQATRRNGGWGHSSPSRRAERSHCT